MAGAVGAGAGVGGRSRVADPGGGLDRLDLDGWPERVRATAVFAAGVLRELQEHGADVRARDQVEVEAAAESPAAGFPGLPAWVTAGG